MPSLLASVALTGCWSAIQRTDVHYTPRTPRLPSVQILANNAAQRLEFCRVFRESGQFSEVWCSNVPRADVAATLRLRFDTRDWSARVGEQVGYGAASLGTCFFWNGGRAHQRHYGTLSFQGADSTVSAEGVGSTQRVHCLLPGLYFGLLFVSLWAPAAGRSYDSWEALEHACGDARVIGEIANTGEGAIHSDRRACEMVRRIVTESASEAAGTMLQSVAARLSGLANRAPAAMPVQPMPSGALAPRLRDRRRRLP